MFVIWQVKSDTIIIIRRRRRTTTIIIAITYDVVETSNKTNQVNSCFWVREENSKNILGAESRTVQLNLRTSSRPGIETQATVMESECSHLQSESWGPFFLTDVEWTCFFFFRETLIILLIGGATKLLLIQQEQRLGSTSQKPSYQRIGTHLSLRSASAWQGWDNRTSGSLSSPKRPTPCIRLLETETTVQPLSATTNG